MTIDLNYLGGKLLEKDLAFFSYDLSTRSRTHLQAAGLITLQDLAQATNPQIEAIDGLGTVSLSEIEAFLEEWGIKLIGSYP